MKKKKEHICEFKKMVPGSEVAVTNPYFENGFWKSRTSAAFVCTCGNQNNLTHVYIFNAKKT